ncbi:MAG: hypothetical protein GYA24_15370 [Candidatus Lokiarchaeota archaeon]|nr:hypothetical protein [Candidatus Lokiarchaeota archaeon]
MAGVHRCSKQGCAGHEPGDGHHRPCMVVARGTGGKKEKGKRKNHEPGVRRLS